MYKTFDSRMGKSCSRLFYASIIELFSLTNIILKKCLFRLSLYQNRGSLCPDPKSPERRCPAEPFILIFAAAARTSPTPIFHQFTVPHSLQRIFSSAGIEPCHELFLSAVYQREPRGTSASVS